MCHKCIFLTCNGAKKSYVDLLGLMEHAAVGCDLFKAKHCSKICAVVGSFPSCCW